MSNIYAAAVTQMHPEDIAHYESDLYLRKNPISMRLVEQFEHGACATEFVDPIDGDVWFNIALAYLPHWHGEHFALNWS